VEHQDELTPLESRLVECAAAGEELDCAPAGATTAEFDQIDDWEERKIRAEVLVALCTGEESDWSVHPRRGLRLRGAYITGQIDLSRAQLRQCPLAFHTCYFEEDVVLDQASPTDLSFTSCALPSLYADGFNSSASLNLRKTYLRQMSFRNADFRGDVLLSEVRLINTEGIAIGADGMRASSVFLQDTHVEGEVSLSGAELSGQLVCREGTELINPEGGALNADSMSASNVFLDDAHVEGEMSLSGAELSGQLACREGTELINPEGGALRADSMSASNVFLQDIHVEGEVSFVRANISGQLSFDEGTKLINPDGYALIAEGCKVEGALVFRLGDTAVGLVNLAYAEIGTLADDLFSWPDTYNLVGFSYNSLGFDANLDRRLRWISNSKPFSPDVYTQLAEVYRRSGHEGFARQVAIRREEERRRQPDLSWGARAWYSYRDWFGRQSLLRQLITGVIALAAAIASIAGAIEVITNVLEWWSG
jgi:uncharacterized protein YjbI with pentapeptide repeats